MFYSWAVDAGRVSNSPAERLGAVTVPRAMPRPTASAVVSAALASATDRVRLMVLLAAYAGLRCTEIARVHPRDVTDDGRLRVTGKGGHVRYVPLHPRIVDELDAELRRRVAGRQGTGWRFSVSLAPDDYLFPGRFGGHVGADSVSRVLSAQLGEHWTAHTLRHRFATSAYAATRDLRAVQELLGHSDPATTARYTLVPDDALRAAVLGVQ